VEDLIPLSQRFGALDPQTFGAILAAYKGVIAELGLKSYESKERAARITKLAGRSQQLEEAGLRKTVVNVMKSERRCLTKRPVCRTL
jgi:hypothetical protein